MPFSKALAEGPEGQGIVGLFMDPAPIVGAVLLAPPKGLRFLKFSRKLVPLGGGGVVSDSWVSWI